LGYPWVEKNIHLIPVSVRVGYRCHTRVKNCLIPVPVGLGTRRLSGTRTRIAIPNLGSYSLLRQAAAFHSAHPDFICWGCCSVLNPAADVFSPRELTLADDSFLAQELSLSLQASIFFLASFVWIVARIHPGLTLELSDRKARDFIVQIALPR
jgi:hypothetical protein